MNLYVSVIIRRPQDGKFLTLHCHKKAEHRWRFPAGKVEPGETFIAGAARELKEEVGVEAFHLSFHSRHTAPCDGDTWTGYYFVCENYIGTPHIQEPEKHNSLTWMSHAELLMAGAAETELEITNTIELGRDISHGHVINDDDLWAV